MRDYLALITSEHNQRPRYMATVDATTRPFADVQALLGSFLGEFDLDSATGKQLDTLARWVGATRANAVPLDGFAFSWDGTAEQGWDNGVWEGVSGFSELPDDLFRMLIRAKIKANSGHGTTADAYDIVNSALTTQDAVRIVDGGAGGATDLFFSWDGTAENGWDAGAWQSEVAVGVMTMLVLVKDGALPAVEKQLVMSGVLPIKPAAVQAIYQTF